MKLINKLICLLFYILLVTEVFPQEQYFISTNGSINNSLLKRSIYDIATTTSLKKNSSARVLDSLIIDNKWKNSYNYTNDLSLNFFTSADWYNGEWNIFDKHTNTYNSGGKLISVLSESFNSTTNEWHQTEKVIFDYDSLGNRILGLHQYFDGQEFVNNFKYEYYYDAADNLVSSVNQHWIDSVWLNSSKINNTFTSINLKDSTLFQDWIDDKWTNYQLNIYEYDETLNIISNLAKRWQEQQWVDFALGKFDYDENNNLILDNWQIAVNNNWVNLFRIFYEYDDNYLIHLFGEEWINGQWVPENEPLRVTNPDGIVHGYLAKEVFLFYSNPTNVKSENNITFGFNLLQNYPNPFNPTTIIKYSVPSPAIIQIKVYDILGTEIKTIANEFMHAGTYEVEFDASSLSSGVYFYRLISENYSETKKMLLLR